MSLKISVGRILGTVTGMALSGPGGAVLGGLAGGLVDAVLPDVSETVGELLGEVGAEMLTASVESVQTRLAGDEIQSLGSDLQLALRDAFCEALVDIGGKACFPNEWKSERDVPDGVVYPRTPEGHRLWHNKDPLAQQVCECLHQMVEAANDGSLFFLTPPADELEGQAQTYLNAETLAQVQSALFRQTLAPYLSSLWELPGFLQHLRRTLVPRLLIHLSYLLKQRTLAWRDFNRLLLEQLQAQVQTVANSQQQVSHQLTQIRERLDAILTQDHDTQALTEWANGLAELLAAMGQLEQRLDEKLEEVLTSVVEGNREVVERLISLTIVMGKVREGVERTESKVDQVIYLLTQREANLNALLESIVADVRGARLPNFVMQNERLITEAHPTPVMLRERQSNYFERHRLFAGRAAESKRIHDFLSSQPSGYIFVTGASGYGKTALLANFVAPHRSQYIWYFLNQLDGTNNRRDFLRQMCEQMLAYYQMPVRSQYDLPEHADHLEALYAQLLRMPLVQANQPLVLVIDGVDEAANNFINDMYIPRHLPAGKFIIFSARETGRDYLEELGLPSDKVLTINLEQLDYGGVEALLRAADATTWADDTTLVGEVLRVSEGDPFYLHELVQDIASGQITAEQITLKPAGLTAYLDGWWQQVVTALRHDRDLRTLMGLLMVTLGPLPSTDLFRLDEELEWGFDDILKPVRRFIIIEQSHGTDTYALCHPRFRDYLAHHKLRGKAQNYRSRLLTYCGGWQQHNSRYALQHYAAHLADAEQWNELHTLVATGDERLEWAEARHALEGSYAGYLEDLGLAWAYADEVGVTNPAEAVGKQVRYALIKSSIHTIAGNIHPDLLIAAVENGVWTAAQALAHVRQMPETQMEALIRLVPYLSENLLDEALLVVRAMPAWRKGEILVGLVPYLPEKLKDEILREALEVARTIKEEQTRAWILRELATHLPKSLKEEVLRDALEATLATSNKQTRVKMLVELAAHLTENLKEEALHGALETVRTVDEVQIRMGRLVELAAHLPKNLKEEALHEALEAAQATSEENKRARKLMELASYLPTSLKEDALHKAFKAARAISAEETRARVLMELAPHLPASLKEDALDEALKAARAISAEETRARVLMELAPQLPASLKEDALDEALKAAQAISAEETRARVLMELAPQLPASLKEDALDEALKAAQAIEGEYQEYRRASVLTELAPHLPASLFDTALREALAAARALVEEDVRVRMLAKLVPHLPESLKEEVLREILSERGKGINIQAQVLWELAEHLPEPLVRQALASAQRKQDRHNDWVMAELALQLAKLGHPQEALEIVRAIKSREYRAEALVILTLDFLPEVSLLQEAVTTIEFVRDSNWRAKQLPELVRRLAERGSPHEALEAVLKIRNTSQRAQALTSLVTHLPESLLHEALKATPSRQERKELAAAVAHLAAQQVEALEKLAPLAERGLLNETLEAVLKIRNTNERTQALTNLVTHLPENLLHEALQTTRTGKEGKELAAAVAHLAALLVGTLEKLAPHLPEALLRQALTVTQEVQAKTRLALYLPKQIRVEILRKTLAQAQIIGDQDKQWRTQEGLFPQLVNAFSTAWAMRLAEEELSRNQVLNEALAAMQVIEGKLKRQLALAVLALRLAELGSLDKTLAIAQVIEEESDRQQVLAVLALRLAELGSSDKSLAIVLKLPEGRRKYRSIPKIGLESLAFSRIVSHKAGVLEKLIPHLSETSLRQALELAQTIEDESWQVRTMAAIASRLAELGAPFKALDVMLQLPEQSRSYNGNYYAELLEKLVPHLPERALRRALGLAQAITDENWRARTMVALVPRLAELGSLEEALAVTQATSNQNVRERTMVALALWLAKQGDPEEALAVMQTIEDQNVRAGTMAVLGYPEKALAIVQAIRNEEQQAKMIAQLAPHLSEALLHQALEIAQAIQSTSIRVNALKRLAPHLSEELHHKVLSEAQELSKRLSPSDFSRLLALPAGAAGVEANFRYLSNRKRELVQGAFRLAIEGRPQEALTALQTISNVQYRAKLRHLPEGLRGKTFREALITLQAHSTGSIRINDETSRSEVLPDLVPDLTELPSAMLYLLWCEALYILAGTRQDLLQDLGALVPVIEKLGKLEAVKEAMQGVQDVGRWWP